MTVMRFMRWPLSDVRGLWCCLNGRHDSSIDSMFTCLRCGCAKPHSGPMTISTCGNHFEIGQRVYINGFGPPRDRFKRLIWRMGNQMVSWATRQTFTILSQTESTFTFDTPISSKHRGGDAPKGKQ